MTCDLRRAGTDISAVLATFVSGTTSTITFVEAIGKNFAGLRAHLPRGGLKVLVFHCITYPILLLQVVCWVQGECRSKKL